MSALRDATAALHAAEMAHLGDEVTYTPEGGSARTFNAWYEPEAEHVRSPGSAATATGRLIEVLKSDVPEPGKGDRITIAIVPGLTFYPADVQEGETGETWRLPLKVTSNV